MKNHSFNEGYDQKLFLKGGSGSKVFSGNKVYQDLSFGAGSLILGHSNLIQQKCFSLFKKNKISLLAHPNVQANNFSNLLSRIFKEYPKFIFCSTGSEAITKALRITKAISGKNLIISVSGSWHGSVDKLLFKKKNMKNFPLSDGLSELDSKNLKFIEYNNFEKSEKILKNFKKKIGCIIIEPIQGCLPDKNSIKYIKFLFDFAKKNKIMIIFDEMITGLRINGTSLQNYLNLVPDITIFGKGFGGGLPIGIIAISKKIENLISKKRLKIFYGGTYSGNSFSTLLAYETRKYINTNKKKIIKQLNLKSKYFENHVNAFLNLKKIPAKIYRYHSMIRLVFTNFTVKNRTQRDFFEGRNKIKIEKFRSFLETKNILYPKNGLIFLSSQTTKKDINYIIKNFKIALAKFL
tara:strand:+ start:5412 stop:6632 length:1221 start_codon:yes stop_codon:yes gene_type:complete